MLWNFRLIDEYKKLSDIDKEPWKQKARAGNDRYKAEMKEYRKGDRKVVKNTKQNKNRQVPAGLKQLLEDVKHVEQNNKMQPGKRKHVSTLTRSDVKHIEENNMELCPYQPTLSKDWAPLPQSHKKDQQLDDNRGGRGK